MTAAGRDEALARIRAVCLALPEVAERPSHGAPTFFVRGKRAFATVHDNHHGDGRFAIWCAAPDGMQQLLVEGAPDRFFVPPYYGHHGWLGVRLEAADWEEVTGILEDAYLEVAPPTLAARALALSDASRDRDGTSAGSGGASARARADASAGAASPRG